MGFVELSLIAVGLSMDAFAVALCKGLHMKKANYAHGFFVALFFGIFQGGMPFLGWLLGQQFGGYIVRIDHWITAGLLAIIGGKMIYETGCPGEPELDMDCRLDFKELLILSIATSIDALAVGITFAFLQVWILPCVIMIGITTFFLSFSGVLIGNRFGIRFQKKAEILGGGILILMAVKILLEHLGFVKF